MTSLRLRLVLAAFAIAASVSLAACSEDATSEESSGDASTSGGVTSATELGASGTLFQPPPSAAGFTLTGEDGQPVSLSDFRGEVVALYFGYTHCPDVCPLTLGTYKAALDRLPAEIAEQVNVVMISVDPERDTPEVLGRYMNLFNERFMGVTGAVEEIDAVLASWDIQITRGTPDDIGAYEVDHPAASWIIDQEGRLRVKVAHMTGTDALAADLKSIVEEGTE
ncbi:MAG: SCO family protein [Dehalococcoidia bacterium]